MSQNYSYLTEYCGVPFDEDRHKRQRAPKQSSKNPNTLVHTIVYKTPVKMDVLQIPLPADLKHVFLNNLEFIEEFSQLLDKYKIVTTEVFTSDSLPNYLKKH